MTLLLRKAAGKPIRDAMKRNGLSGERLAEATKAHDGTGRGISAGTVAKIAGKGETAADECRLRTAWLIAAALDEPLQKLFSMPSVSTDTVER
ncbi:helix-turn-helix transcriptional regulator [Streptomyces virginiae]|uniref:Helix-turn-helix domain-containing protein n=1 Tax=Streptomyces virginiae TaxID=1961 RepID=A0ABZ1TE10_STRVG|nr:helix-turn-helix transcriptional regulator [Streptomyces virginiae]